MEFVIEPMDSGFKAYKKGDGDTGKWEHGSNYQVAFFYLLILLGLLKIERHEDNSMTITLNELQDPEG